MEEKKSKPSKEFIVEILSNQRNARWNDTLFYAVNDAMSDEPIMSLDEIYNFVPYGGGITLIGKDHRYDAKYKQEFIDAAIRAIVKGANYRKFTNFIFSKEKYDFAMDSHAVLIVFDVLAASLDAKVLDILPDEYAISIIHNWVYMSVLCNDFRACSKLKNIFDKLSNCNWGYFERVCYNAGIRKENAAYEQAIRLVKIDKERYLPRIMNMIRHNKDGLPLLYLSRLCKNKNFSEEDKIELEASAKSLVDVESFMLNLESIIPLFKNDYWFDEKWHFDLILERIDLLNEEQEKKFYEKIQTMFARAKSYRISEEMMKLGKCFDAKGKYKEYIILILRGLSLKNSQFSDEWTEILDYDKGKIINFCVELFLKNGQFGDGSFYSWLLIEAACCGVSNENMDKMIDLSGEYDLRVLNKIDNTYFPFSSSKKYIKILIENLILVVDDTKVNLQGYELLIKLMEKYEVHDSRVVSDYRRLLKKAEDKKNAKDNDAKAEAEKYSFLD